ncbi:putative beta-glucosidase M [Fusarium oxysporum f. sp. conglutinans]|nr:putative beta-glucosidase M [Fusarium oxysporum f. sp. conglutinans]
MQNAVTILCAFGALAYAQDSLTDASFYGLSPPVYPAPQIKGLDAWGHAYLKAKKVVDRLTLEEKINITYGPPVALNGCAGTISSIKRVGFPGLCLMDAGNGVRSTDLVNAYASGISVAARYDTTGDSLGVSDVDFSAISWNKQLAKNRALFMFKEFKTKGVNVALAPAVGALGRVAKGGRIWEGFGVDPYLSGALASETIKAAVRVGVQTTIKHYIANEQETNRSPENDVASVSSNVDDKTLHELYLWPFQDAVKAGTTGVMCSYNRVNGSYACGNSKILNGLLKTELGFQGYVLTDWDAQPSGVASVLAGLDMAMPTTKYLGLTNFTQAIRNGSVPLTRLNDMATRILASWFFTRQDLDFPPPGIGMPLNTSQPHRRINARDSAAKNTILASAVEGHVLVKNINNALPLKKPLEVAVFGYSAHVPRMYGPSGIGTGWRLGFSSANVSQVLEKFAGTFVPPFQGTARYGTIIIGGGSGANAAPYISSPFDALSQRAWEDDSSISWDFEQQNPTVAAEADVCLVFINAFASEAFDRPQLYDEDSDKIVLNVARQCNNTMVVIHNAGPTLVEAYADHPNITAIIYAHLPGQDSGRALVSLLYEDENFSGKLPYTIAKKESDYGQLLDPVQPTGAYKLYPQSNFTEGTNVDYRHFEASRIIPRYEFGFGLSYTNFSYSNLAIRRASSARLSQYPTGAVESGGQRDLWDTLAEVTLDVRNIGQRKGQEVVQLYLQRPDGSKWLRGFEKIKLSPGQSKKVSFVLTRRDLSEWDVVAQRWKLLRGANKLYSGSSSKNILLSGSLKLNLDHRL